MSRWPVLGLFSMMLVSGCTPSLEVGLANAPALGRAGTSDDRVSDVISNGGDACGRHAERGPLRGHWPGCATATSRSGAASSRWLSPTLRPEFTAGAPGDGLVVPWLQHFYTGWPCPHPSASEAKTVAVAWSVAAAPVATCTSR
jgi:hypothetical protein